MQFWQERIVIALALMTVLVPIVTVELIERPNSFGCEDN
jgi:hypothetical protein